ncbi:hypothetical protein GCM10007205_14240 [Oxalicibacterium flavum]|uniref:Uncharacterized protein n=1 Tax=Oxalicibacterium flavum TaxID=179467 RepID=A0A8J2UNK6_9BURK|nr:hypothetical protein GCM10007205_14240 [Oxalicibacterium flavum]
MSGDRIPFVPAGVPQYQYIFRHRMRPQAASGRLGSTIIAMQMRIGQKAIRLPPALPVRRRTACKSSHEVMKGKEN